MDELPLLIETNKGISIKYKNRFIYSKYDPVKGSEKLIINKQLHENTIYFIPSPALGYGIQLLKKKLPITSMLLLIEVDENLLKISDTKLNIQFIKNGFNFLSLLNTFDLSLYKRCELLQINGSFELYKLQYEALFKILLNQIHNYWKNRYTLTQMGQLWTKNTLINLKSLKDSKPLSTLKTTKPIVIIGAGESTESILHILIKNRDLIYILCVDTALQILLEMDIIPDVVLALEAQYYNLPDFYGAKDRHIDLIYDLSSYPAVPRNLRGKKYYCVTQYSNSSLLNKITDAGIVNNFIPPLGSVGISALFIGMQITNNFIFLAGLDFSYKLGKTHSKGTPYHKSSMISWSKTNPGDSFINCLKRPLLSKLNKNNLVENTDSILYAFSLHANELLFGNNKVFDITKQGMDLGIPIIEEDKFINLIQKKQISSIKDNKILESSLNSSIFFQIESNKLDNAIAVLSQYLSCKVDIDSCNKILTDIDYFFDHYPENKPLSNLDTNKIKRLYYSLLRFKRQIS